MEKIQILYEIYAQLVLLGKHINHVRKKFDTLCFNDGHCFDMIWV